MLALVLAAQALRWWCIRTLGPRWNTRVIVVPALSLVTGGPYRWLQHPNYVAVVVEGVALPLVHGAWITAAGFTLLNAAAARHPHALRERRPGRSAPRLTEAPASTDRDRPAGGRRRPRRTRHRHPRGPGRARRVVVEPRPAPIDKACGEGLMPGAVRALADLGVVLAGPPSWASATSTTAAAPRRCSGAARARACAAPTCTLPWPAAPELGVPVLAVRAGAVRQDRSGVSAAGITARYLVAADGLHSPIRVNSPSADPDPRPPRYGLRRHFTVAPWTDCVEVHWTPQAEAYVTPLAPDLVGVAVLTAERGSFEAHLADFPA